MIDHRRRMRKLALAYEELSSDERSVVDAYLETDPELRRELSRLHELESIARDPFGSEFSLEGVGLSEEDAAQERASRARLLGRVDSAVTTASDRDATTGEGSPGAAQPDFKSPVSRPRLRPRSHTILSRWVPIAAAAAILIFFLGPRKTADLQSVLLVDALRVVSVDANGQVVRSTPGAWSDGRSFAIRFTPTADASVVVYHVDPGGKFTRAYPANESDPVPRYPGGAPAQIPAVKEREGWVFSGEPGPETFFVASSAEPDINLQELDALLHREMDGVIGRDARVLRLDQVLTTAVGPTSRVEIQHGD